tara:strand:- start:271476 stop:272396 length:921 start_codon:yes stop_codon:yes gene_type:complete
MNKKREKSMKFTTTIASIAILAGTATADVFSDWNLVVRNDLHITSEVDGSAMIGGSVFGTSNYAVQGVTSSTGDGLVVGGNLGAGSNYQINNGGNLRIAGNVNGNANLNGGGSTINDAGVPNMVNNAMNQAASLSSYFAGFSSTGTVDGGGNMNVSSTTVVDNQNVAFFSLNQSSINGLGQLNLNFGSADTVVINFDAAANGGIANFNAPPNLIGGFNQNNSTRIVWNFLNTTELNINNSFNGMVLATSAELNLLGGGLNGSVFVDSVATMNAEIRRNTYTGAVPTPGSLALIGFSGLIVARRKRA